MLINSTATIFLSTRGGTAEPPGSVASWPEPPLGVTAVVEGGIIMLEMGTTTLLVVDTGAVCPSRVAPPNTGTKLISAKLGSESGIPARVYRDFESQQLAGQ